MSGIENLTFLLRDFEPTLNEGVYVFCTLEPGAALPPDAHPILTFQESEGLTVILPQADAERLALPAISPSAWITLAIHSSLQAVGFLAALSAWLAAAGIPCNVVSAYYHDHLFVPIEKAEQALTILINNRDSHRT